MKKDIESILVINRYLVNNKDDSKKSELIRGYLTSKVGSVLESKSRKKVSFPNFLNIPLTLLSL